MNLKVILPQWFVQSRYVNAGGNFGDAVSYASGIGECGGFELLLSHWESWEEEYARRGMRTVSVDRFIAFGGYGEPLMMFLE